MHSSHSSIETCPVGVSGTGTLRWGLALKKLLLPCRYPYRGGFHGHRDLPRWLHCSGQEDGQLTHQSRHRRAGPAPPLCPAGAQPVGREGGGSRGGYTGSTGSTATQVGSPAHPQDAAAAHQHWRAKGRAAAAPGRGGILFWLRAGAGRETFKEKY